jgi:hypothetical protein
MNIVFLILLAFSSPQSLLKSGEAAMRSGNWQEASNFFHEAIKTNRLNEGGQAMSYWNIHVAERNMRHLDESMEAMLGFIIYGSLFIESSYPDLDRWDNQFKAKKKLGYSIALVQAIWARSNNYSCRSEVHSCYVQNEKLIKVFEDYMPFCGNTKNIMGGESSYNKNIIKLNVQCTNTTETYYFEIANGF